MKLTFAILWIFFNFVKYSRNIRTNMLAISFIKKDILG